MPEIFSKDCKMTVIEYGSTQPDQTLSNMVKKVCAFFKPEKEEDKAA